MTSPKPTTEVSRETQLISRDGLFLLVTDDTVEGSQQRIGDDYSKFNSSIFKLLHTPVSYKDATNC